MTPAFARNGELNLAELTRVQEFFLAAPESPLAYTRPLDLSAQVDTAALGAALQVVGRE